MNETTCREFRTLPRQIGRRELLQWGGLGVFGLSLPDLLTARRLMGAEGAPAIPLRGELSYAAGFGKAKACILMFMWGGPSQLETWDLKPLAPREVRGDFRPIATNVSGIQISEHFSRLAPMGRKPEPAMPRCWRSSTREGFAGRKR